MAGTTLIFAVVKLDARIVVTPLGERQRCFIALKFRRFAHQQGGRAFTRVQTSADNGARKDDCPPVLTLACLLRSRLASWLFLLLCGILLTACKRSSLDQARTLVERYNRVVSEAYRRLDVKLIDPVVGPKEGKRLTRLIRVRLDFGLTLDSHLLSLDVTGVEQSKTEMRVRTKERWRYRDLRIGTGKQVGEESLNSYELLYVFTNISKAWLVDEIRFTTPPWLGRKQ